MRTRPLSLLLLLAMLPVGARSLSAQRVGATVAGGPQFFLAASGDAAPVRTDPSRVSALRSRISLDLADVTLETALDAITARSGMRIAYSRAVVPLTTRVSLSATNISIAAALTEVLLDAGVDVLISRTGQITLTPRESEPVQEEPGTVVGRVTETETGNALANAQVRVEGTGIGDLTDEDGRFRLDGVPAGPQSVTVSSIGYSTSTQDVDVPDGGTVTVDFALDVSPTALAELVVTATGRQRRKELGHVVGRIDAETVVKEAPVSSMSELLNARVPGLQVFTSQGSVGGDAELQIRGTTTFLLDKEPIVIVDGVRYFSGRFDTSDGTGQFNLGTEPALRLNDLNPNEIESIEVVKGPSAATLYGTDAVNGVIVITTKRGRPGPAQWNAYTRFNVSEVPVGRFPDWYRGVSSTVENCTLEMVAAGECVQEGIERYPNPLTRSEMTLFGAAPSWQHGLSVSGGADAVRYHVAADYEDATGPVRMPRAIAERAKANRDIANLPDEQVRPNTMTKLNLRTNLTLSFDDKAELQGTVGFTRNRTNALNVTYGPYQTSLVSGTSTPENPFGEGFNQPDEAFARTSTELVNRFAGGLRGDLRPASWLSTWGAIGLDLTDSERTNLAVPGEGSPDGLADEIRRKQMMVTVDLGSRTSVQLNPSILSRTAVGTQYVRSLSEGISVGGRGLPPGAKTVDAAETQSVRVNHTETVTLGGYIEQTFGYRDQLFVTGALRADGGSTFGRDYEAVVYPKMNASWVVSEMPFMARLPVISELRARYAYGGSGRQPTTEMALPLFRRESRTVRGVSQQTIYERALGNPDLRPERTHEHEYGFDAALLDDRVRVEATWYDRTTIDGIRSITMPTGFGTKHVNIGKVKDKGFEVQLTARPIDRPAISWDVTLQHTSNRNEVVELGDVAPVRSSSGGIEEGYPIGGRFSRRYLGYDDANGDGIVEESEVLLSDSSFFQGVNRPPETQTLFTAVGLFGQRLRVSALFDRRAGHTLQDNRFYAWCSTGYCRARVDATAPRDLQALAVAPRLRFSIINEADFVRLREVSVSATVPESWVANVGARSASLSVQARNLALWTNFRAVDPESASIRSTQDTNGRVGSLTGIPQSRSWVLRMDIGF